METKAQRVKQIAWLQIRSPKYSSPVTWDLLVQPRETLFSIIPFRLLWDNLCLQVVWSFDKTTSWYPAKLKMRREGRNHHPIQAQSEPLGVDWPYQNLLRGQGNLMHARQSLLRTGNRHGPVAPQKPWKPAVWSWRVGHTAIPRRDGLVEVENVFDCTSSPASSLLVWVK